MNERASIAIAKMWDLIHQLSPSNVKEKSHYADLCNTLEEIENSVKHIEPTPPTSTIGSSFPCFSCPCMKEYFPACRENCGKTKPARMNR
jgi:hypothetical protein